MSDCIRCEELYLTKTKAVHKCVIQKMNNSQIKDVELCDKCMKYMRNINKLIRIDLENYDE